MITINTTSNFLTGTHSHPSPTSLTFDLYGSRIPSPAVNAAFSGAITKIYPFLSRQAGDPITNDDFQYRAIGGSVQIGVTAVQRHGISWRQLDAVLRQVSTYMNGGLGEGQPHMQELSFEITIDATRVGEGLVSYRPSRSSSSRDPPPASMKDANDTKFLSALPDPSPNASAVNAIHFRIPNTPFKLIFGFLGDAIPRTEVGAAFEGALSQIVDHLGQRPDSPIPGERFEHREEYIRITVLEKPGTAITYKQLSWVLGGMYGFMTGNPEHYQLLTCEISFIGHGNIGFASVWYYPPNLQVTKRAQLNTTAILSLVPPNGPEGIPFPVPDTPITITFTYLGRSTPPRELDAAIAAALDQIGPFYRDHDAAPVPGNHFFRDRDGVRITVFALAPLVMSWYQLRSIVWGLLLFVTGAEGEGKHHRVLNFDVDDVRTGKLAYGSVRYVVPRSVGGSGGEMVAVE